MINKNKTCSSNTTCRRIPTLKRSVVLCTSIHVPEDVVPSMTSGIQHALFARDSGYRSKRTPHQAFEKNSQIKNFRKKYILDKAGELVTGTDGRKLVVKKCTKLFCFPLYD